MNRAMDLAKYIVSKCVADGHPISNLQLQKVLYYIQKDYLSENMLAFPDDIEAWQFGPVVPNVYYHYCGYGSMPISIASDTFNLSPDDTHRVNPIVEEKRELDPWIMVAETHKKNGAWDQIYKDGLGNHQIIPTDLIRKVG